MWIRVRWLSVSSLKRIAPVFAVRDLGVSLAYYERLGFETREYEGGGYGYATRDGLEIHLGLVPEGDPRATRGTAYIWVDDADQVAQAWRSAGAPASTPRVEPSKRNEGESTQTASRPAVAPTDVPQQRPDHPDLDLTSKSAHALDLSPDPDPNGSCTTTNPARVPHNNQQSAEPQARAAGPSTKPAD